MEKRHILLCGQRQVGKSTLIEKLLGETELPVYGFITKLLPAGADGFCPLYMHPAGQKEEQRVYTAENYIGRCDSRTHEVDPEIFNTCGVPLIKSARPGGLIVMDELGFMEAQAKAFTEAVLEALEGDIPVIAAVKLRYDVPFLNAVRAMPKAQVFPIDEYSRNGLYRYLKEHWLCER